MRSDSSKSRLLLRCLSVRKKDFLSGDSGDKTGDSLSLNASVSEPGWLDSGGVWDLELSADDFAALAA